MVLKSNNAIAIRNFYSNLKFPGPYTIEELRFYDQGYENPYLRTYSQGITNSASVLDIGCGSGFIVNFLALRYPNTQFSAIDFGDGIDFAENFAQTHGITNINFIRQDFFNWQPLQKYDAVITNGVLHHMPDYLAAIEKIKTLVSSKLVIGVYNKFGKITKKIKKIRYSNPLLYLDQELCPFELAFSDREIRQYLDAFGISSIYPSISNRFVDLCNLFNYRNGGLTVYTVDVIKKT